MDSVLAVAVRWSHTKVVELLLEKCTWPVEYLKLAYKEACERKNENLKFLLKKSMIREKNKSKKSVGCFSCFSKK
jgi:hypothetical protein